MSAAFGGDGPNPYDELKRINALPAGIRNRMARAGLTVYCEQGRCAVVQVFRTGKGKLVKCMSDANVSQVENHVGRQWSPRRAFFLADDVMGELLTLVCDCDHTRERSASVRLIADLDGQRASVSIREILVE